MARQVFIKHGICMVNPNIFTIQNCRMEDYKNLQTDLLIDMLVKHTENYTRMFTEGATDQEFTECQRVITLLQTEIQFRKSTITNQHINFTSDASE
jgi:hypothetical protein